MDRIYIIGPVSGKPDNNIAEFERVRHELLAAGHEKVDIPHVFIDQRVGWEDSMLVSINHLTRFDPMLHLETPRYLPIYTGVAMLDGWELSNGASMEHEIATTVGIPCKPWREWL